VSIGVGHLQHRESGLGHFLVGLEAAAGGVSQLRISSGTEVQLGLGELLNAVRGLLDDPLDFGGHLLDAGATSAQVGGNRLQSGNLLADEQQQALTEQVNLTLKVVGERSQRNARRRRDAAIGDSRDPLASDQLECGAEDALAGVRGRCSGQGAPE
jgi:hypothetical protein